MMWYDKLNSPFDKFWSVENSIQCLKNQYLNLNEYVENVDQAEKYKNKINELISSIKNLPFEGKEAEKEKIINLLNSKLSNPTKEVYETCNESIENYLKNLKEALSGNQILFPSKSNNIKNYNENNIYIICLNILKNYSIYHRKLTNIFEKSKNILSDIFQLDKEIEIISDILGKYALEKGKYLNMYKDKSMGIIRALILYNIIKFGKYKKEYIRQLFGIFLKLPDLINGQTGATGDYYFNEDILNWARTGTTDLEDYLIIPKFEPKDFLYLFLIIYTEEKDDQQINIPVKGFLFKNIKNRELDTILFQSLKRFENETIEKNQFQNFIEKITRALLKSILPEKCVDDFDKLTYMELANKLKEEKKLLKIQINELKRKDESFENEEIKEEIISRLLNCFTLATTYEQEMVNNKLTYGDIDFFKNKIWDTKLISRYPYVLLVSKILFFFLSRIDAKKRIQRMLHCRR